MKFKPATAATVVDVVRRFADFLSREPETMRRVWAGDINAMFDRAVTEDAFGTEGQNDPRGDHRG